MINRSRRSFLKTSATAAGLCLAGPSAVARALSAGEPEHPAGRLQPFPLASVRLAPGIFHDESEINARYLDSLSVDRLLHTFRLTAGITSSAVPYKGWEDPTCELRGHFAGGHFLSAVAMASASSGNSVLKSRGDELVAGLGACQKKIGTNYLSAYPTELFEHLATPITKSWPAWSICTSSPATPTPSQSLKAWANGRRISWWASAPINASACCAPSTAA